MGVDPRLANESKHPFSADRHCHAPYFRCQTSYLADRSRSLKHGLMTSCSVRSDSEAARLRALERYRVLDTPREQAFDDIAELASEICGTPIAVVNLIGEGRQFFKAKVGLGLRETPLETSFCQHAILQADFLYVPDATQDPRFAGNASSWASRDCASMPGLF
jgi:hypothetical protein